MALMHYYSSKVILALLQVRRCESTIGFQNLKSRLQNQVRNYSSGDLDLAFNLADTNLLQKEISSGLCSMMGISIANPSVKNAPFLPVQLLQICKSLAFLSCGYLDANEYEIRWLLYQPSNRARTYYSVYSYGGRSSPVNEPKNHG